MAPPPLTQRAGRESMGAQLRRCRQQKTREEKRKEKNRKGRGYFFISLIFFFLVVPDLEMMRT